MYKPYPNSELMISIICPLYNKERYVQETIDSVLNQTYKNWEFVIVDDGSTDSSFEMVKIAAEDDNRIRLFKREEYSNIKGPSSARNVGIHLAKGEFILFLDADDLLKIDCLKNRLKMVFENPGYQIYIFPYENFRINDEVIKKASLLSWLDYLIYKRSNSKELYFLNKFLNSDFPWQIGCPLWSTKTIKSIKGFNVNLRLLEDIELHLRALIDKEIKIKDFLYELHGDVLFRKDIERHQNIYGILDKLNLKIEATHILFEKIKRVLGARDNYKLLKGYIRSLDFQINESFANANHTEKFELLKLQLSVRKMAEAYCLTYSPVESSLVNLHSKAIKNKVLKKAKIPSLLVHILTLLSYRR